MRTTLLCFISWLLATLAAAPSLAVEIHLTPARATETRHAHFVERQLPTLRTFLDAAEKVVALPRRLRIILIEAESQNDRGSYSDVYGAEFEAHAREFIHRLERLEDPSALASVLEDVNCQFPSLGSPPLLSNLALSQFIYRDELRSWTLGQLRRLLDPPVSPGSLSRMFKRTGATTYSNPGSDCGVIVFGALASQTPVERSPESSIDTVLHEAAHWIDGSTDFLGLERPIHPASGFKEAFADILAHVFTADPCHRHAEFPGCFRRLDEPLSFDTIAGDDSLLFDIYRLGQPGRFTAWSRFRSTGLAPALPALLAARDAALTAAPDLNPGRDRRERAIEDLEVVRRFVRELESR